MQMLNTVFALAGIVVMAMGMPTAAIGMLQATESLLPVSVQPIAHAQHVLLGRDDDLHSNFSIFCGNMAGTSSSTVSAQCSPDGYNLGAKLYRSHLDLNNCLVNANGAVLPQADGNAMASCSLGAQGRLACPGATCPEDTFAVTCEDIEQVSITSLVDLDVYVWAKYDENSDLVIGCFDGVSAMVLGEFEECTHDGASCS